MVMSQALTEETAMANPHALPITVSEDERDSFELQKTPINGTRPGLTSKHHSGLC
jgi:hypothetical protein